MPVRPIVHSVKRNIDGRESTAAGDEGQIRTHAKELRRVAYQKPQRVGIASVEGHIQNLLLFYDLA
jgi:hypothetical protein